MFSSLDQESRSQERRKVMTKQRLKKWEGGRPGHRKRASLRSPEAGTGQVRVTPMPDTQNIEHIFCVGGPPGVKSLIF